LSSLEARLERIKERVRKSYLTKDEEWIHARALGVLGAQLSSLLRSPAEAFMGLVFGYGEVRDITDRIRQRAMDIYRTDPDKAIFEGLVAIIDDKPVVLDPRREIAGRPNPRFGKPLMPVNIRTIVGLCKPFKGDVLKFFILQNRHTPEFEPELGSTYLFRAIVREENPYRYVLGSAAVTTFKKTRDLLPGKDILDVLRAAPKELKSAPLDLEEWHSQYSALRFRTVIVEGDVIAIGAQPTARGATVMRIGDVMEDVEFPGIAVFVPPHLKTYPVGSRVIVIGTTFLGRDLFTGERTVVTLSAYGVYPVFTVEEVEIEAFELEV